MARLYHYWLSPGSRFIRLLLAEKGLEVDLVLEEPWLRRPGFQQLSPSGWPPVLVTGGGVPALSDSRAISEYLEETVTGSDLLGRNPLERAEVRRLLGWCETRFAAEVIDPLLYERFYRTEMQAGDPDTATIRLARQNLPFHLSYMNGLSEQRRWLAGDQMTHADLMVAACLSVLDYVSEVPWDKFGDLKDWYSRMKSRPGFRSLLADRIAGYPPPKHYNDLDF